MVRTGNVSVDGLNVRYLEAGTGPPVLLLHGASLGSSAEVWEGVMPRLAEGGCRAVAYDHPGYGLTDNPADHTLSYRTAFITGFMDALGMERALLAGHSQSGGMAVRVALRQPERAAGVVVVCTGTLLPPLSGQPSAGGRPAAEGAPTSDPTLEDVRRMMEADVYHKALVTAEAVERRRRLSTGKNVTAAVERSKAREPEGTGGPLWERLRELSVPLLMLYGDHDRASAAERATAFRAQHPELDIRVAPNSAHLLMWDAPDVFVEGVLELVAASAARA